MRLILLAACALALLDNIAQAADPPLPAAAQVEGMQRGVNIVGYDPLWRDASKARFKPRHFELIRQASFNSVRIVLPIGPFVKPGEELPASWFATLDGLVKDALAQDLTVILDDHDFWICARNADECRTRVLTFWKQAAPHFKDASNKVVFEILNEPNGAMDTAWNALLAEALAVIRESNPTRNVVIGPAFWNNVNWLDKLELPKNDKHIIVTVHYYLPMQFTHQGAKWTPEYKDTSGVTWGAPADYAAIDKDFDAVQKWAKKHKRPILLGEFGAYDKAPMESRVKYTAAVARAAEKRGWAWAYWQFDSDFIVYDIDEDRWVEPIRDALIPEVKK
ncbi:MAG TPA: glycoside hydrolase family 5 protein [Steroidobacteraceae bacterium]|nr:glycoside hydrolase family 5 protein [Steroidobacteraceae bacterium]